MLAPLIIGIGCGVVGVVGAALAIKSYESEMAERNARARASALLIENLSQAQTTVSRLGQTLESTQVELAAARARADFAEDRRLRQTRKFREAAAFIGEAIEHGGRHRYNIEDAINKHGAEQTFVATFPESKLRRRQRITFSTPHSARPSIQNDEAAE